MKLNNEKFYVVYNPTEESEKMDIFNGRPSDINGIRLQLRGGLKPDLVYGFYNHKATAQRDADKLWKKQANSKKSQTYGIYTAHGKFMFKKQFNSETGISDYLDNMYAQGNHYAAFKLTESPKRVTKVQLKRFKNEIDASDLNDEDLENMMQLYLVLESSPASQGMILAHSFDTFQREFIPSDIWVAMGGKSNKS